ncbi:RagB/SusD family nutrient uptake outer membrane protein [Pedobacter miscanthi]|uniref:RagB/SusD family nutrient uptake outer membrane protein n=1 Tax=Pedobacter miscanthi TaxID=2259170 RepID=A0A366LDX7_9SPHI|nr:RagB/SusD family nutrient uptake outer membrane protein [Pedobacter miscanthi]RBQ12067.1 hypothetical protein DRW42_02070 [Pedobacter miscanthi]
MKNKINFKINQTIVIVLISLGIFTSGCEKYLDIPLPVDRIAGEGAFLTDNSASAVVSGNFTAMYNGFGNISSTLTGGKSIGFLTGLYSDEVQPLIQNDLVSATFYKNILKPEDVNTWRDSYSQLVGVNVAIEGIKSTKGPLQYKSQWLGESLVTRAFIYFNLVNLFGDVALTTTGEAKINNTIGRSAKSEVYGQIVKDLQEAQSLLSTDYKDGYAVTTSDRGRPNKLAATALLAKVYLYQKDWKNAEDLATTIINNPAFQLAPLATAFATASKETIWAVGAPTGASNINEYNLYNGGMPANSPSPGTYATGAMSNSLVSSFEQGDQRFSTWVRINTIPAKPANGTTPASPAVNYYFPNKYKAGSAPVEHAIVLRLAELYLIRAEARANLSNVDGSRADINVIRSRAGLGATTAANKEALIEAIIKERRNELFTELGNRYFDLKRTDKIDAVMNIEAPLKGGVWNPLRVYWPIPTEDIKANPNLTQTPGY